MKLELSFLSSLILDELIAIQDGTGIPPEFLLIAFIRHGMVEHKEVRSFALGRNWVLNPNLDRELRAYRKEQEKTKQVSHQ